MFYEFIVLLTVMTSDNRTIHEADRLVIQAGSLSDAKSVCEDYADVSELDTQDNPNYRIIRAECVPNRRG